MFLPKNFVLDNYPINFGKPQTAKWRKKVVFKSEKKETLKSKATLNWTSKKQLKLSFTLKKINLTEILDGYDLSEDVVLPVRFVINEKDSGIIQQAFSVK